MLASSCSEMGRGMRSIVEAITGSGATPHLLRAPGAGAVSWREIHHHARSVGHALRRRGIGRGSRVGLPADTSLGVVTALQAVWLAGAAATLLPPSPPHRDRIISDAELSAVLDPDNLPAEADTGEFVRPDPGDLAILQYTSGSTSRPRGVAVTHRNLAANLCAIETALNPGQGHPIRVMSWLPFYHDMGLIGFLCLPMARGWELVLQSPGSFAMRPKSWFETISRYQISVTGGPNFAFRMMTRLLETGLNADLSSLRFMLCGGEPIDAATMTAFMAAARPCGLDPAALVPAYGLAEATLAVTIASPGAGVRTDTRDGRSHVRLGPPVPGTTVRITDLDSGDTVPDRHVGLVEVSGPSVTTKGWLNTGDLGYLADGELVVCGRQKEVLFAAGRNIYPQDVEAALTSLSGVRGAAAFGIPGPDGDQLIVAAESRDTGLHPLIAKTVLDEVGLRPSNVLILRPGRIPRTSSGKLRRVEMRRLYQEGLLP